jgi:hypothetical protein
MVLPLMRTLEFHPFATIACLALLVVVAAPADGASLPYAVRAWTIEDGLPTSTVQGIASAAAASPGS